MVFKLLFDMPYVFKNYNNQDAGAMNNILIGLAIFFDHEP